MNKGYSALDRGLQPDASTDVKVVDTLELGVFLNTWSTLGSFLENWQFVEVSETNLLPTFSLRYVETPLAF